MVVHPLESSGKRSRSVRGALPSVAVHAAIVLVAVHATAHAAISHEQPAPPSAIRYFRNAPPAQPEHPTPPTTRSNGPSPLDPFTPGRRLVKWPIAIPDRVPVVDSSAVAIDRSEFGPGVKAGPLPGSGNAADGSAAYSTAYSAADVERPVSPVGAAPIPAYPEALRSSGTRGSVTAEFVVDTTGHVVPGSFRAIASGNDLFTAAVREAVLRTRFHPAEAGGRRVRQLVQESFSFVLQ